eukprot:3609730-Amphidinium_carterae.1
MIGAIVAWADKRDARTEIYHDEHDRCRQTDSARRTKHKQGNECDDSYFIATHAAMMTTRGRPSPSLLEICAVAQVHCFKLVGLK